MKEALELDLASMSEICAAIASAASLPAPGPQDVEYLRAQLARDRRMLDACRDGVITFRELCDVFHANIRTIVCIAAGVPEESVPVGETPEALVRILKVALAR